MLDILYLLSSDKSDLLNDESDNVGSGYGSSGTQFFFFSFSSCDSVARVSGLASGIFSPTGVDSKCDIFEFVVFVPIGVEYKGCRIFSGHAFMGRPVARLENIALVIHSYDLV